MKKVMYALALVGLVSGVNMLKATTSEPKQEESNVVENEYEVDDNFNEAEEE